MKIECVTTCVDYSDFLAETLPHNRVVFDNMVVVTAPEDTKTRKLCEYWNVMCLPTDVFGTRWGEFHKGKGINVGLSFLEKDAWIVHMDADILLPPLTRVILDHINPDPAYIYGIDRYLVRNYFLWRKYMECPTLQQENRIFVHLQNFPVATRVCSTDHGGYLPIGYFQMWHASSGVLTYPEHHTDAGRGDMLHANKWPRALRALIPEIVGYHLESELSAMGTNWNGRKTRHFGLESSPCDPQQKKPYGEQTNE